MRLYNECPQESEFRQEFAWTKFGIRKIGSCRVESLFALTRKIPFVSPLRKRHSAWLSWDMSPSGQTGRLRDPKEEQITGSY